jgi:prepilin-type N-terminal cleavage/methylation domain-containing protein
MKNRTARGGGGFTLVEIMIVVAIIGLLAAIAIPNWTRARDISRTDACINNLRQIDGAKHQWALENGAPSTATPGSASLNPYLGRLKTGRDLFCPLSKSANQPWAGYLSTIGAISSLPTCGNYDPVTHKAALDPNSQ